MIIYEYDMIAQEYNTASKRVVMWCVTTAAVFLFFEYLVIINIQINESAVPAIDHLSFSNTAAVALDTLLLLLLNDRATQTCIIAELR